jgi:hypothetical protein
LFREYLVLTGRTAQPAYLRSLRCSSESPNYNASLA